VSPATIMFIPLCLAASAWVAHEPATFRIVEVHATVKKHTGEPVVDATVVGTTSFGFWKARTDERGEAVVRIKTDPEDRMVQLRTLDTPWIRRDLSSADERARREEFRKSFNESVWPAGTEVAIVSVDGSDAKAMAVIQGFEPVRVRASLISHDLAAISAVLVEVEGLRSAGRIVKDAKIDEPVRKGAAGEIRFTLNDGRTIWKSWDAQASRTDVDLGAIGIETIQNPGTVRGEVLGISRGSVRPENASPPGATLLSADGKFSIALHEAFATVVDPAKSAPAVPGAAAIQPRSVPAGEYFVVPGAGRYSEVASIVRQAIIAGEDVVKEWSVQKIIVESGKETVFRHEAEKVHQAVLGSAPKPGPSGPLGSAMVDETPEQKPAGVK
jgi:hypothetical protein